MRECCRNCRYYMTTVGVCRRYPPAGGLALVGPADWCGEWVWRPAASTPTQPTPTAEGPPTDLGAVRADYD